MDRPETRHGTYAGYNWHVRYSVPVCDPCQEAQNRYMQRYRAEHPDKYEHMKAQQNLRLKAMRILAQRHPQELRKIIKELTDEG